jgi:type VI secretion system secreted protein VgrG
MAAEKILGKPCRFELTRDGGGEAAAYCGVASEFSARRDSKPVYTVRVVPWIQLLSLNVNNRVFQKLTVLEIIKKVIQGAGIENYCDFRYECGQGYQPINFCVQHRETDLNFISRLMELNGIWYYFESGGKPEKERVVIADSFSKFPARRIEVPFVENTGLAEVEKKEESPGEYVYGQNFGESIYSLTSKRALIPVSVKLRAQNYRTPENSPEGACETGAADGAWGSVYEYGGNFKNADEAARQASLYMKRIKAENLRTEGKSRCAALRAGRFLAVKPDIGEFLIVSVSHKAGEEADRNKDGDGAGADSGGSGGAFAYNNEFSCIDSGAQIYAPPLRAAAPLANGLITAPVEIGRAHV